MYFIFYGFDLSKMALVNGAYTLRRTVYWKREEQCSPLRELEKMAF